MSMFENIDAISIATLDTDWTLSNIQSLDPFRQNSVHPNYRAWNPKLLQPRTQILIPNVKELRVFTIHPAFKMDHSHMDHSGMDHGGMNGPMCNMNVRSPSPYLRTQMQSQFPSRNSEANLVIVDALHLGHNKPLHYIPLVAHPNGCRTDLLPPRRRCSDCRLRSHSIVLETIRSVGCEETGGSTE